MVFLSKYSLAAHPIWNKSQNPPMASKGTSPCPSKASSTVGLSEYTRHTLPISALVLKVPLI